MVRIILLAAITLIFSLNIRASKPLKISNKESCSPAYMASDTSQIHACTFKGIPLKGKVKIVEHFGDIKIQFVNSFPDINVKIVESFPDDCGEWRLVESFPDFTVEVVTSFPDIKVKIVESFPGVD